MAWRDSRGSRTHLLLSMAAIALGIGALVAIRSFGDRMDEAIELQTRSLLGADYSVRALQPFNDEMESFLNALPGEQVRETRFFSMVSFPRTASVRLSQIRALSGPFPFYGHFDTDPPEAALQFFARKAAAVVEESLLIQFEAELGDTIRIGAQKFTIIGRLRRVSGEAPATSAFLGPRVYISMQDLPATELLREGSLARYYAHYQLKPARQAGTVLDTYRPRLAELRLEMETAEERRAMAGGALENLYRYLNLGGFVALLLGGIGLAASINLYARKKRTVVAILRCIGADAHTAFLVYLIQAVATAFGGALLGLMLGGTLQYALPALLTDFLPVPVESRWVWRPALSSLIYGLALSAAFALLPLLPLRRVSPLAALRPDAIAPGSTRLDPLRGLVLCALAALLTGFAIAHTDRWTQGLLLAALLGAVFILLALSARLLMWVARRALRDAWPFAWRQGIANIHRPYNQTSILLLALGLGSFLLATLSFTQANLVNQFRRTDDDGQPNMILFDIQRDQVAEIEEMIRAQELQHVETTPIVTMRLTEVNGRSVAALRDDPQLDIPHWVLFREYRSTYREVLDEHERVIQGAWQGRATDPTGPIPISIDQVMADHLRIGLNARLTFNIQGVQLDTYVRSIRNVDWRRMRTNFFVIFPAGILEDAPQVFATVTRAPGPEISARLQHNVIQRFPNVSAIDLRMVVESLDEIVDQAAQIIRFMALFSLFTGLLVLGGTVMTSRYDRKEEAGLLRTLGATRGQLNRIMAAEYLILGAIASITGLLLALLAGWSAARWLFDLPFRPALWPLIVIPLTVSAATLSVGVLTTRALNRSRSQATSYA